MVTKISKKTTLSPVQQKLTDDVNKSNAKRGIKNQFVNDALDMSQVKPRATGGGKGGKFDMSKNIVFTKLMDIMYDYLPLQMQNFYNAVVAVALANSGVANCQKVFDYWNKHYMVRQDLVTVMNTYGGMLLGLTSWDNAGKKNITRRQACNDATGSDTGALIELQAAA